MQAPNNSRLVPWLPLGVIVLATVAAYANSFQGQFLLDDGNCIYQNPSIKNIVDSFTPPDSVNIFRRQLVNVTLALNYAMSGFKVWSYHLFNLLIHLGGALALFGIVRRVLEEDESGRYAAAAPWLAMTSAVLWAVHPLQTQAVTYIIQRCESLAGLCILASLLLAMIAMGRTRTWPWQAGSVACCLAGAFTKETIFLAPLFILLYDHWYVSPSFKEALSSHRYLYAGHLVCLVILGINLGQYVSSGTTEQVFSPWAYALSQPEVILHYLKLAVWPVNLCLDYHWPETPLGLAVPLAAVILAMLAGTVWLIRKRSLYGLFLGWFWLCLAPSSSFFPINDLAFEHRMYLPLAGLAGAVSLAAFDAVAAVRERFKVDLTIPALVLWLAVAGCLVMLTVQRNADYAKGELFMWQDVIGKRPDNPKAQSLVGKGMAQQGHFEEAIPYYLKAVELEPDNLFYRNDLVIIYEQLQQWDKAEQELRGMIRVRPDVARPYLLLGKRLMADGRTGEAIRLYEEAVANYPEMLSVRSNLAMYYYQTGQRARAVRHLEAYLAVDPDNVSARRLLERLR